MEVVLDSQQGQSTDDIHTAHPSLTLAQIHAALAYYYDNQQELDSLIRAGKAAYQRGYESPDNRAWRETIRLRKTAERKEAAT